MVLALILPSVLPSAAPATEPQAGRLALAGCGAQVSIARLLARAFSAAHPELRITIDSVGSTNGVWLASTGAADIGLSTRALWGEERALGVTVVPYARTALIVTGGPAVGEEGLTASELLDIYRGVKRRWRGGEPVVLLSSQMGDSGIWALRRALPGFARAYADAELRGHAIVLYDEESMLETFLTVPGTMGLTELGTATIERLSIKALRIDGVAPSLEAVASGHYPFTTTLSLVFRATTLPPAAESFIRFIRSEAGQGILRANGYLPGP